MVHKLLSVDHHQQDTDYYCGAACAQMVLQSIGAGVLDQVSLYNDNHAHSTIESGWASGPDGLNWTMNDRKPASFGNYFVLYSLGSEDLISRKLIWTIHHYQVAPIALVYGWAHWIAIVGYDASANPSNYADTSYSINAFDVNNPWPPTPSPGPPPPHSTADVCGSGGMRGVANENISYATWQSTYMTGVPGGHWSGQFVAVCDPEPPPVEHGQRAPTRERREGGELLGSDAAIEFALRGIKEYGLREQKPWAAALRGTTPGKPVIVERLDRPGNYYYIVPMGPDERTISAAVSVDAIHGDYQQAVALPEAGPNFLASLGRTPRSIIGRALELPDEAGHLRLRKGMYCEYPVLVWRPCRESLSPFYPFRMITVGDHRVYIRSDGEVFTHLHTDGRGI